MKFRMNQNVGEHIMIANGKHRVIRPGDEITCAAADLRGAIDKFEVLEADPQPPASRFTLKSLGHGFYNVIHPVTGAAVNSKKLSKAEAEALVGITVEEYDAKVAKEAEDQTEAARLAAEAGNKTEGDSGN